MAVLARARRAGVRAAAVRADAAALMRELGEGDSELAVVLTGDAEMMELNRRYRGKNRPTDVLAFAMREGRRLAVQEPVLGDVVISLETAARQVRGGKTVASEVRALLIHGLLHLLGYDHERSAREARRMRAKERELSGFLAKRRG